MVGMAPNGWTDEYELEGALPILSRREVRRLLDAPDGRKGTREKRDKALLAVLVWCGLRASEARTLTRANVVETAGRMHLRFKTLKRRDGHVRLLTLPASGAKVMRSWLAVNKSSWVFPGNAGKPMSLQAVENRVNLYLAQIGRSDLHTHSLRHTNLSILMQATSDIHRVARAAGHKSITSTEVYLSWSVAQANENADALAGALRLRRSRRQP